MNNDDPRHGTYAGAKAHRDAAATPCLPCAAAELHYMKRYKHERTQGKRRTVRLGEQAHAILMSANPRTISNATGLAESTVVLLRRIGPDRRVYTSTRTTILSSPPAPTPIGVQRRLQALAALGWPMRAVAKEIDVAQTNLGKILNKPHVTFVRREVAAAIVAFYDQHQKAQPVSRWASAAANKARARGWGSPLAWDDIDDPCCTPTASALSARSTTRPQVDPVVVERILCGHRISATRAELEEVVRRVMADPERTLVDLEERTGLPIRSIAERLRLRVRRAA